MKNIADKIYWIIIIPLWVLFLVMIVMSFWWKMAYDLPVMLYFGYLIDKFGMVPYRDFLDVNMAGSFLGYSLLGKLFSFTNIGMRVADIFILSIISTGIYIFCKDFNKKVAFTSVVFFGIIYLSGSPSLTLQREYFIVLLLSIIFVLNFTYVLKPHLKYFLIGILFGIGFCIKPHTSIGLLGFIIFLFLDGKLFPKNGANVNYNRPTEYFVIAAGFFIPVAAIIYYLVYNNAFFPMLDFYKNYLPLYSMLTGDHMEINSIILKVKYCLSQLFRFGYKPLLLLPSSIALYFIFLRCNFSDLIKRKAFFLVIMGLCYAIYPVFAGQFWGHHWLMYYFIWAMLSCLCLLDFNSNLSFKEKLFPIMVFVFVLIAYIRPHDGFNSQLKVEEVNPLYNTRVNEITEYFEKNYNDNEKVLLLDWVGGSMDAALNVGVLPFTPYVYDYYFYHHISNEYIQKLRIDFIKKLEERKPELIVRVDYTGVAHGLRDREEFKELEEFISREYTLEREGYKYKIYKQK